MRDTFVRTLVEIAHQDRNVYLVTGDLGFGVLKPFWEQLPDQFINAGIAEQNMTSLAAGMAMEGKVVFTYSIGNFPTLRCLEQIRNDCAYHSANVKIVCVGGGFVYGALGMSHHATEDLSIMRALPGVSVFAPGDSLQAQNVTRAMYEHQGTCYLRLGRGGEKRIQDEISNFFIGDAYKVRDGEGAAIFFTGAIYDEVYEASHILNSKGLGLAIYSFPTIKPLDKCLIESCAKQYDLIATVEENNIAGGFGSAVSEVVAEMRKPKARILRIGVKDVYASVVGSQKYLRDIYGISAVKIADMIMDTLNE